jgi:hypothetical protein
MPAGRIRVSGERRDEIDTEQIAIALWLQTKRILRDRRESEAKAKRKREGRHRER